MTYMSHTEPASSPCQAPPGYWDADDANAPNVQPDADRISETADESKQPSPIVSEVQETDRR